MVRRRAGRLIGIMFAVVEGRLLLFLLLLLMLLLDLFLCLDLCLV